MPIKSYLIKETFPVGIAKCELTCFLRARLTLASANTLHDLFIHSKKIANLNKCQ